jgi:hypothetical protein
MSANVIRSLLSISRNGQSGVLQVEADGVCTMIYVLKGMPVFAEEGTLGETLGRLLLREGQISQQQYARIIESMTGSVIGAEQMRFGEVAIALGFLTPEQVNEALAEQVQRKVERCIECELGHCAFRDAPDELEGIARYPIRVEPLVMRTVRAAFDEARVSMMLEGAASSFPELVVPPDVIGERFEMDPAEAAFLNEVDGSRTVFQLIYKAGIGPQRTSQIMAVLLAAEAVLLHDEPLLKPGPSPKPEPLPEWQKPEPLIRPDPVPVGAVAKAPPSAAAPRSPSPSDPSINSSATPGPTGPAAKPKNTAARRSMLLRLTRQISRGSDTTGDEHAIPPTPAAAPSTEGATPGEAPQAQPAPAKDARLRAEQLFLSGKRHAVNERWRLALPQLDQAARLYPAAAEYGLYAEWARFQTLSDPTKMAALANTMKKMAIEALAQDKQLAFAHHVLGQIQMMQGDEKAALRSFRVATKLDKDDRVGARFYRMLARKHGERLE